MSYYNEDSPPLFRCVPQAEDICHSFIAFKREIALTSENSRTGKPIPDDEPVFVLRAQDLHALHAMRHYLVFCTEPDQVAAVNRRIADFEAFAVAHPERMKEPDEAPLSA